MVWSRPEALAMERRHVVEAEKRCKRQRALIERIREQGHSTIDAEQLLDRMEDFLRMARLEVCRLEKPSEWEPTFGF
jgi:hypothetical protein